MKTYPLETIVAVARERSAYYRDLYKNVPENYSLEDLPIIDQTRFWEANSAQNNRLLTAPMRDGIVFKSGGTSGDPKFSVYDRSEWESFVEAFGRGIGRDGVRPGDRVANLFFAGELYASFLFIHNSLARTPVPMLQFPLGGAADFKVVTETLRQYEVNVLAGLPVTFTSLADYVEQQGITDLKIDRILFGGENMYDDQRALLAKVFPGVTVSSIGYASVDAGLLGFCDESCAPAEHRCFDGETVFEIVDEDSGEPICETGRAGKVIITNLTRLVMPILRYPAGDRAEWVEEPGNPERKFRILGRSEEGARVGPMTLYVEDIYHVLQSLEADFEAASFQMVVTHFDNRDAVCVRVACRRFPEDRDAAQERVVDAVYRARHMFPELANEGKVHPLKVEWISPNELEVNPRSGKLRRVIDRRMQS